VTWPEPRPGLVIRYTYLWVSEARAQREEATKNRPCAIILTRVDEDGRSRVYALPITHSAPLSGDEAVEIPRKVKEHLGLDSERSWVVISEANAFFWPGPDLRFLPGQGPASAAYGFLPPKLLRAVRDRFLALRRERRGAIVRRTE